MHFLILALGALFTSTLAAPSTPYTYARHEKRNNLPPGWVKDQRLPGHEILPMRIGLAQSNLDKAEQYLMEVSHPDSPKYGQHWTAKQIAETFAASQESVDGVTEWLKNSGIAPERIRKSQSLGWLHFNATVAEAEDLLKTEYYLHKHTATGKPHVACYEYHIPDHLQPHVDFVTPTVHFDTRIPQAALPKRPLEHSNVEKRDPSVTPSVTTAAAGVPVKTKAAVKVITNPNNGYHPKKGEAINIKGIIAELQNCNQFIVPDCLRALYKFPPNFAAHPKNSYGLV